MTSRLTIVFVAALVAACGPKPEPAAGGNAAKAPAAASAAAAKAPLLLSPEDLRTVTAGTVSSGPVVSGSLQPERRADLRAEVAAVVLQVLKDNGEAVRPGDLLVRLDDTALRDSLASAEEAERAATQALEQGERTLQRLRTLQAQGMTSMQALEDAEVRRNAAQSEVAAARTRTVTARQALRRTEVRAPFAGLVSERKVSAGDTVQVGRELLKVIDPASLRFEGLVSADRLGELKTGQRVSFRVNGVPGAEFAGTVRRIDAAANATTRQAAVTITFDDAAKAPRVAGLFAEGRIETGTRQMLTVPDASLMRSGDATHVWRVQGSALQKVAVKLGERDERRGDYPVLQGLAEGDRILRSPGSNVADGQAVEFAKPMATAAAPAASAAK